MSTNSPAVSSAKIYIHYFQFFPLFFIIKSSSRFDGERQAFSMVFACSAHTLHTPPIVILDCHDEVVCVRRVCVCELCARVLVCVCVCVEPHLNAPNHAGRGTDSPAGSRVRMQLLSFPEDWTPDSPFLNRNVKKRLVFLFQFSFPPLLVDTQSLQKYSCDSFFPLFIFTCGCCRCDIHSYINLLTR